ncbi:metal-dependent hydrolase [Halovivax sp.]|uniref:metal-dependent hydrolase n=1 Tax=Halovivax sp. TaxID=1935978 RepID=UPI0025BEC979|nr:metal-dependent hydrolase [Halovivax sp.]
MQPVVHLFVGYLCWSAYARFYRGEPPAPAPAAVAVFGAALPDLIDKPLAAWGVVPVGRTIGHSLLFAVPLVVAVWLLAIRFDGRILGVAFAVGYLSHIAADVPWHVIAGDFDELGFLLWPITEMPPYTGVKPLGTVAGVDVTTLWLEAAIVLVAVGVWLSDGTPGLRGARRRLGEW